MQNPVATENDNRRTPLDPLKRVLVPRESPHGYMQTTDGTQYVRDQVTGAIRGVEKKIRGKAARRADKVARRQAKIKRR